MNSSTTWSTAASLSAKNTCASPANLASGVNSYSQAHSPNLSTAHCLFFTSMTRAKLSPSPVKILTSSTALRKSGKSAPGTSSSATKIPPRPPPPRARHQGPSCVAGQPAQPKHSCPNISNIFPQMFCPSSAASPATWEPPFPFAAWKAKSRSSSKPRGVPSKPSATSQASTLKPPSSLTGLTPCSPISTVASVTTKLPLGTSCRTQEPFCVRIYQCGWLSGSVAVRGRSSLTHPAKLELNQRIFRQVNVSAMPRKEECHRGSETRVPRGVCDRCITH